MGECFRGDKDMGGRSLSSSLSYLSSLLCSLGIKPFPSQFIFLAAANHPSATIPLLSFLSDLIAFHLAFPPLPGISTPHTQSETKDENTNVRIESVSHARADRNGHSKNHSHVLRQSPLTLDDVDAMPDPKTSQEEELGFVKFYLAMWGYAPGSPFFTLSSETNESRQFMLALGWLISHCDIFNRALEKRFNVLMGKNTHVVTNTYLNSLAMDRGREAKREAEQYVSKLLAASNRLGSGSRAKAKALGDMVLMLCGRLRMKWRSVYALISCKAKRNHELNQMQLKDDVKGPEGHPFSPFELHLLEHQKSLEKYVVTLEMAKCMIEELVECNQHERNFWQWMGEVASEAQLHLVNKESMVGDQQITSTSTDWTTNLLPIINYFRTELNGMCSAEGRSHLQTAPTSEGTQVDFISAPIMNTWRDIQKSNSQATATSWFGTNNEDLVVPDGHFTKAFSSLQNHLIPKETACNSEHLQCLDEKQFESIKDIATMLASTLAKIRIKNRAVIQEALKESMEKKDYFFVGL